MNVPRLIIFAGAIAYGSGVVLSWWIEETADRTPLLYLNLAYAAVLLIGSYRSTWVQRKISTLMVIAIYSIQAHGLYLLWENDLPPSLVGVVPTITLAPIATFGYAFSTLRQLVPFLLSTIFAVLLIGTTVQEPQVEASVFIVMYISLASVCLLGAGGQLQTLDRLTTNLQRERALVDAIPDAMLRLSSEGEILDQSIDVETALGQYLVSGADDFDLLGAIEKTLDSEGILKFEHSVSRPDGTSIQVEVRMVKSGENEVTAILRDTTDEVAMKAGLMVADRMAALGTLSVGVGHEINNPLMYVAGNIEYALELLSDSKPGTERDGQIREALLDAEEGAERVKRIVRDLKRSVPRERESDDSVANASSAMEFAVRVTGKQVEQVATLNADIPSNVFVHGAEGKLSQVLLNLLLNSMQAFPSRNPEHNCITARIETSDDDVVFEISDNGPGIDPAIQEKIFDPFFTTKEVGKGTGLGLYVCHQIIADFGGTLTIESELGKGTTARIALSRAEVPQTRGKTESELEEGKLKILVIDDEPGILKACARMMSQHDVTTCVESSEALDLIVKGDFDAIFCDIMMPKLSGIQLYDEVTRAAPDKADLMVFITGGAFSPDVETFLATHADNHLFKPFDRADLLQAVDGVQERRAA